MTWLILAALGFLVAVCGAHRTFPFPLWEDGGMTRSQAIRLYVVIVAGVWFIFLCVAWIIWKGISQ